MYHVLMAVGKNERVSIGYATLEVARDKAFKVFQTVPELERVWILEVEDERYEATIKARFERNVANGVKHTFKQTMRWKHGASAVSDECLMEAHCYWKVRVVA